MQGLFYLIGVVLLLIFSFFYLRYENKKRKEYETRDEVKTTALMLIADKMTESDN